MQKLSKNSKGKPKVFKATAQCLQCRALLDESDGRIKAGVIPLCKPNRDGNPGHRWENYVRPADVGVLYGLFFSLFVFYKKKKHANSQVMLCVFCFWLLLCA